MINEKGVHGYYWSSSLYHTSSSYSGSAYQLQFIQACVKSDWNHARYYGSSVRGVCKPQPATGVNTIQSDRSIYAIGGKIYCEGQCRILRVYMWCRAKAVERKSECPDAGFFLCRKIII